MKLFADFHTHTRYSHGSGNIRDNVLAAMKKDLTTIGISDHGPANLFIGTSLDNFKRMRDEIDILRREFEGMEILLGCEANLMSLDGEIDIPDVILDELDYCMVGFHPLIWPLRLKDFGYLTLGNLLTRRIGIMRDKMMQRNTDALINAMRYHDIQIITHPGKRLPIDTAKLAASAVKYGSALEINSRHGYMTTSYVKKAKEQGAMFSIGSDAHRPEDVGNFSRGIKIAQSAGLLASDIINAVKN